MNKVMTESWLQHAARMREIVVVVSALEPAQYPGLVHNLQMPSREDFESFDQWRYSLDPEEAIRWLGIDAEWLKHAGAELLEAADRFDSLGDWIEIVAAGDPQKWNKLPFTGVSSGVGPSTRC